MPAHHTLAVTTANVRIASRDKRRNKMHSRPGVLFTSGIAHASCRMSESYPSFRLVKITSCILLLFFSVSATIFTEASKREDGTYPYNTFVIPCAVEAVKLMASSVFFLLESLTWEKRSLSGSSLQSFVAYSFPALCYFVSNNCMFDIIRYLGAPKTTSIGL